MTDKQESGKQEQQETTLASPKTGPYLWQADAYKKLDEIEAKPFERINSVDPVSFGSSNRNGEAVKGVATAKAVALGKLRRLKEDAKEALSKLPESDNIDGPKRSEIIRKYQAATDQLLASTETEKAQDYMLPYLNPLINADIDWPGLGLNDIASKDKELVVSTLVEVLSDPAVKGYLKIHSDSDPYIKEPLDQWIQLAKDIKPDAQYAVKVLKTGREGIVAMTHRFRDSVKNAYAEIQNGWTRLGIKDEGQTAIPPFFKKDPDSLTMADQDDFNNCLPNALNSLRAGFDRKKAEVKSKIDEAQASLKVHQVPEGMEETVDGFNHDLASFSDELAASSADNIDFGEVVSKKVPAMMELGDRVDGLTNCPEYRRLMKDEIHNEASSFAEKNAYLGPHQTLDALRKILDNIPKENSDEDSAQKYLDFLQELADIQNKKIGSGQKQDERLQLLAKAQGYVEHILNPDKSEDQYSYNTGLYFKERTRAIKEAQTIVRNIILEKSKGESPLVAKDLQAAIAAKFKNSPFKYILMQKVVVPGLGEVRIALHKDKGINVVLPAGVVDPNGAALAKQGSESPTKKTEEIVTSNGSGKISKDDEDGDV